MVRLKLDSETWGLTSLFEKFTRARVKDCFVDGEIIYFIVAPGEMGKALGKGAINIKKLNLKIGKSLRIIEYDETVAKFVKNVIMPVKVETVEIRENKLILRDSSKKTKSLLIGREGRNLKAINRAVKRFFPFEVVVE